MSAPDTIVAIATPLGEGGLGVVRLSGSQALSIATHIFKSAPSLDESQTHTLHHGWVQDQEQIVDEGVAAVFRAPHSYTGEDVIEISCHGSPAVLKKVLALSQMRGARLARPGEFTERAYLNGKMDLLQAEAVADLIHARSEKARLFATHQLRGTLSKKINAIRQKIIDLVAHLEANLDFAEEEVPPFSRVSLQEQLGLLSSDIQILLETGLRSVWYRHGLRVVLSGKPNVGKSSLFNALLMQDRAIVTDVPGTTRDVIEENSDWEGMPVILIDTAGLRETSDIVETQGTERARRARDSADVILYVIDGTQQLSEDDLDEIKKLKGKRYVVVFNKSDQKVHSQTKKTDLPNFQMVETSATLGHGLSDLKKAVLSSLEMHSIEKEDAAVVTSERHLSHLQLCLENLGRAQAALEKKRSEESVSLDLHQALKELDALLGINSSEEILSSIFRQFCIGK